MLTIFRFRTQDNMLQINNLHAAIDGKPILKGLTLSLNAGEVHAIMGPNGAGKSTLGYVLGGRPGYEVTEGSVTFNGTDLLELEPHERAAAGLFLGFQYPVEIPGVSNVQFLRESLNSQRRAREEAPLSGAEFLKLARAQAAALEMDAEMLKRPVNVGFSGGEKKRNEMVQMGILNPSLAILDETDSGLDIDALRIVARGVHEVRRERPTLGIVLITHYQRLLNELRPDVVHVLIIVAHEHPHAVPSQPRGGIALPHVTAGNTMTHALQQTSERAHAWTSRPDDMEGAGPHAAASSITSTNRGRR